MFKGLRAGFVFFGAKKLDLRRSCRSVYMETRIKSGAGRVTNLLRRGPNHLNKTANISVGPKVTITHTLRKG